MGCNCGKARRSGVAQPTATSSTSTRTRVRFFVVAPPEVGEDELVFDTLYEARAAVRAREGWVLQARRVPVEG
jgi:hypothetical protein